jgi:hypothetical protein
MDPAGALREAVSNCIQTRDHPSIEARDKALAEVALLLEDTVRDGLDDRELAASLDGLVARNVISDGASTLNVTGVLWTLGMGQGGSHVLPMEAHLSLRPDAVSVVRVADRRGLVEPPESERQFQRVLAKAAWQHSLELRLG